MVPDEAVKPDITRMMKEYGNQILRICYIYLRDYKLSEDAMQDTFIKVYKNYHTFIGESDEKTWITSIAINVCRDYCRTSWFKSIIIGINSDSSFTEENPANIDSRIFTKETSKEVLTAVSKLKPKYKDVILLHYYQNYSTGQISKILHIPEGTVCTWLSRARQNLKKLLNKSYLNEI